MCVQLENRWQIQCDPSERAKQNTLEQKGQTMRTRCSANQLTGDVEAHDIVASAVQLAQRGLAPGSLMLGSIKLAKPDTVGTDRGAQRGKRSLGSEQRKHPRFRHIETAELASGSHTFSGTSLNVSRGGMRVVVKMPPTHDSVQTIAFSNPWCRWEAFIPM